LGGKVGRLPLVFAGKKKGIHGGGKKGGAGRNAMPWEMLFTDLVYQIRPLEREGRGGRKGWREKGGGK